MAIAAVKISLATFRSHRVLHCGVSQTYWDNGPAMLSSDLPSASTPSLSSAIAAISRSNAATRYPKLTCHAEPVSMRAPNTEGAIVPPMAVPMA